MTEENKHMVDNASTNKIKLAEPVVAPSRGFGNELPECSNPADRACQIRGCHKPWIRQGISLRIKLTESVVAPATDSATNLRNVPRQRLTIGMRRSPSYRVASSRPILTALGSKHLLGAAPKPPKQLDCRKSVKNHIWAKKECTLYCPSGQIAVALVGDTFL